jgi:hypothetical protein
MSEITVSWDASPTPGATYDVFRGTAPGNESTIPYASGITNTFPMTVTTIAGNPVGTPNTRASGTFPGGDANAFQGMRATFANFASAGNNGVFVIAASTATTIDYVNPASVAGGGGTITVRPYFIDTAVRPGQIYVYKIDAVVAGVHSLESVEVISEAVPFGASPPALGLGNAATAFEVLGGSTITNTGASVIDGDIGVWPGTSITGFGPPAIVTGVVHSADFVAQQAQSDLTNAYNGALAAASTDTITAPDIGGQILGPGVYTAASSVAITGTLYLDAGGNLDAVWIFQIGSTLNLAASSSVVMLNGGQAKNVFWAVGSSATLNGPGSLMTGTIMAQASISATAGVNVNGRLLARTGAVTLIDDNIDLQFASRLEVYLPNTAYLVGDIIFDCATQSFQQAIQAGTSGSTRPSFSPNFGVLTVDGTVVWQSLDNAGVLVLTSLPPAPANVPPAPPAAPTNPAISSET